MFSLVEYISNIIIYIVENLGYLGVFLAMTVESACIPLPSEVIMPFAGFAVYEGKMSLLGITVVGALGNLFGSLIAYFVGLKGGRPFLEKYGKYILLTHSQLERAEDWFEKYGHEAVFVSRVLPGIRTFISLPAGIARMDLKKFITYTFLGSLPWCFVLGYLGVQLGPKWDVIRGYFHILDVIVILAVIGVLTYFVYQHKTKD
ncbi:MAG: DedA family protein [Euryarchaeota archaeon]|jgi:membrane protein DedA with SNARE-associated domain|uniref:DedA family protein n=1 Tax=Methanobacterium sp. MZD130B TaxID=3394378 RepID=UPI0009CE2106|nr:DedA family protein [Euryarchaeota archaeon]OPZ92260.1 MAG: Inner membrane protein YohD [Firmicutes bacterium ADurb.Bin419]HHT17950.1 DedA family protein [Methanobacterium sp.]